MALWRFCEARFFAEIAFWRCPSASRVVLWPWFAITFAARRLFCLREWSWNTMWSRRATFFIFCTLSLSYIQGGLLCRLDNIYVYMRLVSVVIHSFTHVCAFHVNDLASIKQSFALLRHAWRSHLFVSDITKQLHALEYRSQIKSLLWSKCMSFARTTRGRTWTGNRVLQRCMHLRVQLNRNTVAGVLPA